MIHTHVVFDTSNHSVKGIKFILFDTKLSKTKSSCNWDRVAGEYDSKKRIQENERDVIEECFFIASHFIFVSFLFLFLFFHSSHLCAIDSISIAFVFTQKTNNNQANEHHWNICTTNLKSTIPKCLSPWCRIDMVGTSWCAARALSSTRMAHGRLGTYEFSVSVFNSIEFTSIDWKATFYLLFTHTPSDIYIVQAYTRTTQHRHMSCSMSILNKNQIS